MIADCKKSDQHAWAFEFEQKETEATEKLYYLCSLLFSPFPLGCGSGRAINKLRVSVPLLDRPTFDSANRFGTASAGQAVLFVATNVFFARPEQWHISREKRLTKIRQLLIERFSACRSMPRLCETGRFGCNNLPGSTLRMAGETKQH